VSQPLTLISGSAHPDLAGAIGTVLGVEPAMRTLGRYPDGERWVSLGSAARGHDVYIVQPAAPPVDEHLIELLLIADACRRAGAARITAVIPYLGYARQDRRRAAGQPVSVRLVADLLSARFDRALLLDPHGASIESAFGIPVEQVSAVTLLATALRDRLGGPGADSVVIAPDMGAVKLAERYAAVLDLPTAFVRKTRINGSEVRALQIAGDVRARTPLIVDDMITTGSTIAAAVQAATDAGARTPMLVAATHGVFVGDAFERLRALPVRAVLTTDSLPGPAPAPAMLQAVGVAPLLGEAIRRLHADEPLDALALYR
jgi:ribose-phosphate pyrophosphokinase